MRISDWSSDVCSSDLIEAVEGPIALTACCDEGRHDCGFEGSCQIQPHLGVVNGAVRAALAGISLASLVKPLPPAGGVWGGPVAATNPTHIPPPNPSRQRAGRTEARPTPTNTPTSTRPPPRPPTTNSSAH